MSWDRTTAQWWAEEVGSDPAYANDVDPLLEALIPPEAGGPIADLGCGTGRSSLLVSGLVGFDTSRDLVRIAATHMTACVADVTRLPLASESVNGAIAVLVLEHLETIAPVLDEARRAVEPGGFLVVITNHPVFTAPGSGPFVDADDGEVLWRWGEYLAVGYSDEPAGETTVRFHHRPLGIILTTAARAGWALERVIERPAGAAEDPLLAAQGNVPRLLGLRWAKRQQTEVLGR